MSNNYCRVFSNNEILWATFLIVGAVIPSHATPPSETQTPADAVTASAFDETAQRPRQDTSAQDNHRLPLKKPTREICMIEEGFLWIDAEDFDNYGGWTLDSQFVHRMGSSYLIAASVGNPVDDATLRLDIPKAGRYQLWVRSKNWLKDYSPGKFTVRIGDTESSHVFGAAESDAWLWQRGGVFELPQGNTSLAIHDLTGYYGRCDALILTTNLRYTPPNERDALCKERARLTGLSLEPTPEGEYDVVVVGAGAAGCCAAIASARMGATTALIQNRPVLGGNASVELGVPICGAGSGQSNARESGIIEEAGRIKARFDYPKMSEPFRLLAEKEKNLTVFLNRHVFSADMNSDRQIGGVKAVDTLTGQITTYRGKQFVDCTGDGWLGYFSGAQYRFGRESREEFAEDLAPAKADDITMSGCLMGVRTLSYRATNLGKPISYRPPAWAAKLPPPDEFGRSPRGFAGGQWWLEHQGELNDLTHPEKARDELLRITYGYWDYIKNYSLHRHSAINYALTYVPITDAKRESRRLVGDYLLTQNDVQEGKIFADRISYGGWPLDVHHARGIYSGKEGPFHCDPRVPLYTIPFRCLYSANIDNLLFAGRNVSVTHIALGTVRVQGTLAALGQAAGTAAALCAHDKATPRALQRQRIAEFQQILLKHDQYIPEIRNEDPRDLARSARLTASSTGHHLFFDRKNVRREKIHPLNLARAVMFPRGVNEGLESVSLLLSSDRTEATPITLHVREADASGDFSAEDDVVAVEALVPAQRETWVEFKTDCTLDKHFAWVWLPKTPGISWRLMSAAPIGSCRAYGGGKDRVWQVHNGQQYAFATKPSLAIEVDYHVQNITNGTTRGVGNKTNLWASDPKQSMPHGSRCVFPSPCNSMPCTSRSIPT